MGKPIKEYMMEQPEMMRRLSIEIGENIREVIQCVGKEFERIFLVGSGTSLNAALAARYVFEAYIQAEVQVFAPLIFFIIFQTNAWMEELFCSEYPRRRAVQGRLTVWRRPELRARKPCLSPQNRRMTACVRRIRFSIHVQEKNW